MTVEQSAARPEPATPVTEPTASVAHQAPETGYARPELTAAAPTYPAAGPADPAVDPTGSATVQPPAVPGSEPYAAYAPGVNPYGGPPVAVPDEVETGPVRPERVLPGLGLALLAIPVGAALSAIIFHLGFVSAISTFVLAALAAFLYRKGSGGVVRRGIPGLALIILLGATVSFFASVASDLSTYWNTLDPEDAQLYGSRSAFIRENLFYGPVLADYAGDAVKFGLFALLGGLGVIVRLARANRAERADSAA